jgi:hypothetical protein
MTQATVNICNEALRLLGEVSITSLSEGTELAETCALLFETTARGILASYPWRCTLAKARLPRLSEAGSPDPQAPSHEWRYRHQLPGDLLMLRELAASNAIGGTPMREYEVFGASVLSNQPDLWADYQRWITPDLWPAHLREAAKYVLAAQFAVPVTGSTSLAEQYRRFAYGTASEGATGGAMGHARRVDAQQQPGQRITSFPLMEARLSGAGWRR